MNENERKWLITQIKSSKPTIVAMETVIKVIVKESEKQKYRTFFLIPCALPFFIGLIVSIGTVRKIIMGIMPQKDFCIMFAVIIALLFPFFYCVYMHIKRKRIIKDAKNSIREMKESYILSWLPYEHRNPVDYKYISDCILSNKVSSISEAIDLLKKDEVILFVEKITGDISRQV